MRMHLSSNTSNSGGYSDLLCTLIRRAVGYQNAGKAHLERGPTTVLPENCALLLQERSSTGTQFYRNAVLQERSLQEHSLYRNAVFYREAGASRKKVANLRGNPELFMQLVSKSGKTIVHSLVIKILVELLFAVPMLSFYRMSI